MPNILFLDVETSDTKIGKKRNPSPYIPGNTLVSVGFNDKYVFLNHKEYTAGKEEYDGIQSALNWAETIVAFNGKFDVAWLLECGFEYDRNIYDPMIVEYILARGLKWPLSLDACCERRKVARKQSEIIQEYWDAGLGFYEIPLEKVELYGRADVQALKELYYAQQELLQKEENKGLLPTINMSNEFIWNLIDCERNGIHIDEKALKEVEDEFTTEYNNLARDLDTHTARIMGDRKVNLASPEQLSQVIYSRQVIDKRSWAELFNLGTELRGAVLKPKRRPRMSSAEFIGYVRSNTRILRRAKASHCEGCQGRGLVHKITRNGTPFKKPSQCVDCQGEGYILEDLPAVAGFQLSPESPEDVAAGGFKTDGDTLERLSAKATGDAKEFLTKLRRHSALETYLGTFVKAIKEGRGVDGLLHTQLMQAITATGRLSSQQPNFQNMPRGQTFPVRRVVSSRWLNGEIIEVDFAKLEYATAVFLAQDRVGMADIQNGVDAHALTAEVIGCSRQDAKPHTFKPLYGGSSGSDREKQYYVWFKEKHSGITEWQERNKEQVINTGYLTIPSGREYFFPGTKRLPNGWVTNTTQICNYPVQGFATGDIVPIGFIELRKEFKNAGLQSLLILTVHDSYVTDVYPGEKGRVVDCINAVFRRLPGVLHSLYGFQFNVALGWEIKGGPNWLNMKEIYKDDGKQYCY